VQTVSNIQDKAHLNSLWNLNVEHRKGFVESTSCMGCAHEGLAKRQGFNWMLYCTRIFKREDDLEDTYS
jgi:hypothetical protein